MPALLLGPLFTVFSLSHLSSHGVIANIMAFVTSFLSPLLRIDCIYNQLLGPQQPNWKATTTWSKGLPLLGNVNDLPKPGMLECHHWLQHREKYGPISSITVLGQTFIIINDAQIALELLRDRAAAYSARAAHGIR